MKKRLGSFSDATHPTVQHHWSQTYSMPKISIVLITWKLEWFQLQVLSITYKNVVLIERSVCLLSSLSKSLITNVHENSLSKTVTVNSSFVMSLLIYPHRPTPIIYWIKEDGTLPVNRTFYQNFKKTLQITQVSEADSGNYQCIAKNTLGAVHHTISVTVKGITPPQMHPPCPCGDSETSF